MQNWMQRLALFAILGAILSSAVLVGCGGGGDDADATPTPSAAAEKDEGG